MQEMYTVTAKPKGKAKDKWDFIALGPTVPGPKESLGAYLAVGLTGHVGFGGAVLIAPLLVGLLGVLFERFLLRRFYSADPILSLLLTFGLAMVAEQLLRMIWGASPLPASIPSLFKGQIVVGEFLYSRYRLLMLLVLMFRSRGLLGERIERFE